MSSDPQRPTSTQPSPRHSTLRRNFGQVSLALPSSRRSTAPFAASPLHTAMSIASLNSESTSSGEGPPEMPTRADESVMQVRPRAHSRSTSAPISIRVPHQAPSATSSRSTSPGLPENRRSVKHLTCFWWKERGACRYSEEECLYAHHDTGRYTDPPRQVVPGEPARAGRSLDRALRSLAGASNGPLSSLSSLAESGSSSTGFDTPLISTASTDAGSHSDRIAETSDSAWLRNLIEQSNREKAVLFTTIENLQSDKAEIQADKQAMQATIDKLQAEKDQLTQERNVLRGVVEQLQYQSAPATNQGYGLIGGNRNLGARASWTAPSINVSRASSYSDTEQDEHYGDVIRGRVPNF